MKHLPKCLAALALLSIAPFARAEIQSEVLAEINLARTAPQAYAQIIAQQSPAGDRDSAEAIRFLQHARPLPPLRRSEGLDLGARLHVESQGPTGGHGHGFGRDNPFSRMDRFGEWSGCAGENISYGPRSARSIVTCLIIDRNVSGRGHRKNIFSPGYGVAGVAYGRHAAYGTMCVIDFAGQYAERGRLADL